MYFSYRCYSFPSNIFVNEVKRNRKQAKRHTAVTCLYGDNGFPYRDRNMRRRPHHLTADHNANVTSAVADPEMSGATCGYLFLKLTDYTLKTLVLN